MANLEIGDKAPLFALVNQEGNLIQISDYAGSVPLVIYFYPKNFTPGCTAQACSFRDQYADFKDAGAVVFGISTDSISSHKRFGKKHNLPFDTLADVDGDVRNLYGVKSSLFGLLQGRETFIIDREGIIQMRFNSVQAIRHIPKALRKIQELK